jgi:hypothetical protein
MYSLDQFARGLANPHLAVREAKSLVRPAYLAARKRFRRAPMLDVPASDWDNLLILDACRYDLFAAVCDLEGDLTRVVSRGTGTNEFLRANFEGGAFGDVVYVTANPHLHFRDARFHDVIPLWDDHWDDDLDTVPPEAVSEATLDAHERYPNKRLLVHFVQPHYPFIGEAGRRLADSLGEFRGFLEDSRPIFRHLAAGDVDTETVWNAYRENLEVVLPAVDRLADALPGKTVASSDHGNAFGEWGVFGHGGPPVPALVDVPWFVFPVAERKEIVSGSADVDAAAVASDAAGDGGVIQGRLERLGYL